MPRYVVLGAGMVGSVIARDLARDEDADVVIIDRSREAVAAANERAEGRLKTRVADCGDPDVVKSLVGDADVVCGALASRIGLQTLDAVIGAGKPYCDISFMPEDALQLDEKARDAGVPAVVDCGVAPGMSNLLAAEGIRRLDKAKTVRILVGGVPIVRARPWEYKAGFAPSDVLEEYVRPARFIRGGERIEAVPLTEVEHVDFEGVGTLEAFLTDGLRSLMDTLDVPDMVEKTMRWPGHAALMETLRDAGFLGEDPIDVGGTSVSPLALTSALLFPQWSFEDGEGDYTIMRIEVGGTLGSRETLLRWDLHDEHDPVTDTRSMSRTTAYPCAIISRMLAAGKIGATGVLPPERLVKSNPEIVDPVLEQLGERGVNFRFEEVGLG